MLYSVLDVDNLIYMRLDNGTKAQPELVTKSLSDAILALEHIKDSCIGTYRLVECVVQQPCWSI